MKTESMIFNLEQEAIWHKKNCDGSCNVSLYIIGETIAFLRGTPLTDEERAFYI